MDRSDIALAIFTLSFIALLLLIRAWASASLSKARLRALDAGYKFAKSKLISGELTPDALLDMAHNAFDVNDFDRGVMKAVHDYLDDKRKINDVTK